MVSLIAAMARREYYAQPDAEPKEAFARALRRVNEVVDEFFKSAGAQLSVGIFALPGNLIMVSKLGSFKMLLARSGQVIDILNNVMLFSKEHLEKRRFSSVISGSIHDGDRMLAYYPAKPVVARERQLKAWLLAEPESKLRTHLERIGQEHPGFSASFLHVHVTTSTATRPAEPMTEEAAVPAPTLAWAPRQATTIQPVTASVPENPAPQPQEVPHIIPTEFSLGIREWSFRRMFSGLRFVRMDTRGKVVTLAVAALIIAGGALAARSFWFTSPEEQHAQQVLQSVRDDLASSAASRSVLLAAQAKLAGEPALNGNSEARSLSASITDAMDKLDNAQPASLSVLAQLDPKTDTVQLAVWSSSSGSLWAVTSSQDTQSVVNIRDGSVAARVALADAHPDLLVGWKDGVLAVDRAARTVTRVSQGAAKTFSITTQDTILDAAQFADNLYILTDASILKVSGLDTDKPATKVWLVNADDFVPGAARILVDGDVYAMAPDGTLTTYYKGKKTASVQTPLVSADGWRLVPGENGASAVADVGRMRVYEFSPTDGTLTDTLKVDSEQPLVLMAEGPDGSVIAVTRDNRIWQVK